MELEYSDMCEIIRMDGTLDDDANEVGSTIYSGPAELQIGGNNAGTYYSGFQYEHDTVLFIPVNNILFKTNDVVKVSTYFGRELEYTILNWEPIKDDFFEDMNNTCLWLKDGTEK